MIARAATGLAWLPRILLTYSSLLALLCLGWWAGMHWLPLANSRVSIPIGSGRTVQLVTWPTSIRLPGGSSGGGEHWVAIWYQDRPNGPLTILWGTTVPLWPLVLPAIGLGAAAIWLEVWRRQRAGKRA